MRCERAGARWREDATNADTDRFRAFVRHEIVARAKDRNPRLLETLTRTMNLIADEDDLLEARANEILLREAARRIFSWHLRSRCSAAYHPRRRCLAGISHQGPVEIL